MILLCILLLSGIGAAIIGSVAPTVLLPQIIFYILGLGLFYFFSKIDYRVYSNLAKFLYVVSLVLLLLTIFIGFETRGSVRWISVGAFRLQFSEILKPIFVVIIATFLNQQKKGIVGYAKILTLCLIPALLIFKQPDLGSTLVYFSSFLTMIFISGIPMIYLVGSFVLGATFLPIAWHFLADYQKLRFSSFLNPGFDPLGASYNAIQAVIAVGSGMFFGRGLGRGTQSHLLFLPEHHTDFVFAAVSEEFGFIGATFVLVIYFLLIWKIFNLVGKVKDSFAKLILAGIGSILLVQVFINVGMNLGLIPVTGITLPLISYGGSSVLATMISLGIVQNITLLSKQEDSHIIGL